MNTKASLILKNLEKLQGYCISLPYQKNDARGDFFKLLYDVYDNFYKGYIGIDVAYFLENNLILPSKELLGFYANHVHRFKEMAKNDILERSYLGDLNRRAIVDAWSAFEVCITSISKVVFTDEEKKSLLEKDHQSIIKMLKNIDLDDGAKNKLSKLLIKKHLSHVSINQKYDKLFKKIRSKYNRDQVKDREFLVFWGRLRNTMHANYIFTGKDFEYQFQDYHFIFNDGKVVTHTCFNSSPRFIILLFEELMAIFLELSKALVEYDYITYLDPEASNFEI